VKLTIHLYLVPRSRKRRAIPPIPQYVFMAWCLVKHRENFYFTCGEYSRKYKENNDCVQFVSAINKHRGKSGIENK
jgi:hypothetical protein